MPAPETDNGYKLIVAGTIHSKKRYIVNRTYPVLYFQRIFLIESPIKKDDLIYFDEKNPRHIAVFMMILLTVYVARTIGSWAKRKKKLDRSAERNSEIFRLPRGHAELFGSDSVGLRAARKRHGDYRPAGMGVLAAEKNVDGKVMKGHNDITIEAIRRQTQWLL